MLIIFIYYPGDTSCSNGESHSRSSPRNNTSNFTISTHSAFQPKASTSTAQRAHLQNREVSTKIGRLEQTERRNLSNSSDNELNNSRNNTTLRIIGNAEEITKSEEFSNRQR